MSERGVVEGVAWAHVSGQGPPAVLVHGVYPGGPDNFAAQQPLTDTYSLIAVDRRGYGANPAPPDGPLGWPADSRDLEWLLERLGGAHLVGHSYGGVVCALTASRRPDLVGSLVLVDPAVHVLAGDDPAVADLVDTEHQIAQVAASQVSTREWAKAWMVLVLGADPQGAEAFLGHWSDADWAMLEVVRREQPATAAPLDAAALTAATFPKVLVVGGKQLPTAPSAQRQTRLGQALTRAWTRLGGEVVVFEHSTHFAPSEEPDRFNQLLRDVWSRPQTRQA